MAYKKQSFKNGQVLTADHLNNIEKGITINERYHGLKGKKVSFLGDSITTFQGWIPSGYSVWYPKFDIQNVEQTWWKQLINVSGMELVKNCSWSGSKLTGNATSTTNATAGCSAKRISDLADGNNVPDIIIILISINDFRDATPLGEWKGGTLPTDSTNVTTISEGYALMVSKIMKAYPHAEVFCCTVLEAPTYSGFDDTPNVFPTDFGSGDNYTAVHDYNNTIRNIALAFGANVMELHSCGITYFNYASYMGDGLHPNAAGAKLMAKKALSELETKSRFVHLLEDEIIDDEVVEDGGGTEDEGTDTKIGTWYIDVASNSTMDTKSLAKDGTIAFAYVDSVNAACIGKPINALRLAVAQAGTFTYGKKSDTEFVTLGTIELVNPSKELQIYEIPEVTLAEGEKLWFQNTGDTGLFYYQNNNVDGTGSFLWGVDESSPGTATRSNLSIDIGYFTEEEFNAYEN